MIVDYAVTFSRRRRARRVARRNRGYLLWVGLEMVACAYLEVARATPLDRA
jgi:hypothetical protein